MSHAAFFFLSCPSLKRGDLFDLAIFVSWLLKKVDGLVQLWPADLSLLLDHVNELFVLFSVTMTRSKLFFGAAAIIR